MKKIKFAIKSWRGRRKVNQDSLACAFNKADDFIAVVCDGVGSIKGSENASKVVADTFIKEFENTNKQTNVGYWFRDTLDKALNNLTDYANKHNTPEIATTIATLVIVDKQFYTFNIGDTRIYGFDKSNSGHEIKKYSYDHNYKNYLISHNASQDKILASKAKWHALTNLVDAANHNTAKFEANSGKIDKPVHFLICTDGLYAYVHDNEKVAYITSMLPTPWKLTRLNIKAYKNGSNDNISGILVSVK